MLGQYDEIEHCKVYGNPGFTVKGVTVGSVLCRRLFSSRYLTLLPEGGFI